MRREESGHYRVWMYDYNADGLKEGGAGDGDQLTYQAAGFDWKPGGTFRVPGYAEL